MAYTLSGRTTHDIQEWMPKAKCKDADPDMFFPDRGETHIHRAAVKICNLCKVKQECFEYAMTVEGQLPGIWGGTGEHERRKLKRDKEKAERLRNGEARRLRGSQASYGYATGGD